MKIRAALPADTEQLAEMWFALWPHGTLESHRDDIGRIFAGTFSTLPMTQLVAENGDGRLVGFVDVGLRSHADACDPRRPAGFIEGWFVAPEFRRTGIGAALVRAAEEWAREQGCVEMASDALIDNVTSHLAHAALGYQIVERAVHFRKQL